MTLDIIGALYLPPVQEDGEATLLPGFHVNTTTADMRAEWDAFRVEPSPLSRVWAGDDPVAPAWTVPLRFADEGAARTALAAWWTDDE